MNRIKTIVVDLICLSFLLVSSLLLIYFYFNAHYITPGYADWLVHAFRAKFIEAHGAASWTHLWSNGINVLGAYQFIPHLITIAISKLFSVDIPRAMIFITIGIFVIVHIEIYFFLRVLKFSPFSAFFSSLLTFTLIQYWEGVNDYSLQFVYLFFPIMIYIWIKSNKKTYGLLFPFLIGISFYIHPILAFFSGILYVIGIFLSDRKIVSLGTLIEVLVIIISSSLFWYPVVFKDSYVFQDPFLTNKLRLGAIINRYSFIGLSLSIIVTFTLSIFLGFTSNKENHSWVKKLIIFNAFAIILSIASGKIDLPIFLSVFQFTRGIAVVGISIAFTAAFFIETIILKSKLFRTILLFSVIFIVLESIINVSIYSPRSEKNIEDVLSTYINTVPDNPLINKRIFIDGIENVSYFDMDRVRVPYSWMSHFDSNPVSPRISALVIYSAYGGQRQIPFSSMERIDEYFKLTAVDYVAFDAFSPFSLALNNPVYGLGYVQVSDIKLKNGLYRVFKLPESGRNSVIVDPTFKKQMNHFPFDLKFSDNNDFIELDNYVKDFTKIIYSPLNTPLEVKYPSEETLSIDVPKDRYSNDIYIAESYGKSWKATFNGKAASIKPVGPNFMLVTLPDSSGGKLFLQHSWPEIMRILAITIVLLPLVILFHAIVRYLISKRFKKEEDSDE